MLQPDIVLANTLSIVVGDFNHANLVSMIPRNISNMKHVRLKTIGFLIIATA